MSQTQWFKVDLETLDLLPSKMDAWPEALASDDVRMQEECLESLIALNLERLFPGEQLLLVCMQTQLDRMADVLAVDPVGMLRVIEVKKERVGHGDLEDQVVSYALQTHRLTAWTDFLAASLPDLPETLARAIEGFRQNLRIKAKGKQIAQLTEAQWKKLDRFAQARVQLTALRKARGATADLLPLEDPRLDAMCQRLYGVGLREAAMARSGDAHIGLRAHREGGAIVFDSVVREFAENLPTCWRWSHPVFVPATDLNSMDLAGSKVRKDKAAKPAKAEPMTTAEFVRVFVSDTPRELAYIQANARVRSISTKAAAQVVKEAVATGKAFRWDMGNKTPARFATIPQTLTSAPFVCAPPLGPPHPPERAKARPGRGKKCVRTQRPTDPSMRTPASATLAAEGAK